jgi:two-component system sensor histidine kinase/response regulator
MSEEGAPDTVVVIDDDYAMRLSCRKILSKLGFHVETFENGAQGLESVASLKPALVVVDLKMPGISGMDVIPRVREIDRDIIIIVITGYATIDTAVEAMKSGAYDFLPKPFSPEELRLIVHRGLDRRKLALRSKRAEMERELLKRRFVSFVSHQLKTPLVAIHQYLGVLKYLDNGADPKRIEWFDRCLARTEEMQALVHDWLTLAKLEGQCLAQRRLRVDLKEIVTAVLAAQAEPAASRNVTLESRLPECDCAVRGDPNCVSVLVENLVVNAIKYNKPGGSVTVSAEAADGEVELAVSDTGIGIPEQYRERLFDEFFRVGDGEDGGTGLGLAICRKVATELGGGIRVESEVGAGSTFRVRLLAWT